MIHAKELMIGDWAQVYGHNNDTSKPLHWYARRITIDWLVDMESRVENDVLVRTLGLTPEHPCIGDTEPIPLTEGILKANGFLSNGEFPYKDHIKINHNNNGWFVTFCECYGFDISFVHELQHAIRLCGLNDLADNIKIA